MTSIQIFIITIETNNFYLLIVHIMLLLKDKLSIINMTFLQNNCFNR